LDETVRDVIRMGKECAWGGNVANICVVIGAPTVDQMNEIRKEKVGIYVASEIISGFCWCRWAKAKSFI